MLTAALAAGLRPGASPSRIVTTDLFYDSDSAETGRPRGRWDAWLGRGAVAVEMEAATIFTLGRRLGVATACLLAVSDTFRDGERQRIRRGSGGRRRAHGSTRRRSARGSTLSRGSTRVRILAPGAAPRAPRSAGRGCPRRPRAARKPTAAAERAGRRRCWSAGSNCESPAAPACEARSRAPKATCSAWFIHGLSTRNWASSPSAPSPREEILSLIPSPVSSMIVQGHGTATNGARRSSLDTHETRIFPTVSVNYELAGALRRRYGRRFSVAKPNANQ